MILVVLSAMLTVAGVLIAAAAWVGAMPTRTGSVSTGVWTRAVDKVRRLDRRALTRLGAGLGVGAALFYVTGWPIMLVVGLAGTWGLPLLLAEPPQNEMKLLEALDRWVRTMLGIMSTGKSITDALRLSARQAPPRLAGSLALLVKRLDDRWTAGQALFAMADELGSPDADAVLAALILSVQRGGSGASITLRALADTVQERLKALREIEAERSKPRAVVRQITLITVLALAAGLVTARSFFAPYSTPVGQLILVTLLTVYVGSLYALRRMTLPRGRNRILRPLS